MCCKLKYNSKSDALFAISKQTGTKNFRAYYCNTCKSWHVTSQPKDIIHRNPYGIKDPKKKIRRFK